MNTVVDSDRMFGVCPQAYLARRSRRGRQCSVRAVRRCAGERCPSEGAIASFELRRQMRTPSTSHDSPPPPTPTFHPFFRAPAMNKGRSHYRFCTLRLTDPCPTVLRRTPRRRVNVHAFKLSRGVKPPVPPSPPRNRDGRRSELVLVLALVVLKPMYIRSNARSEWSPALRRHDANLKPGRLCRGLKDGFLRSVVLSRSAHYAIRAGTSLTARRRHTRRQASKQAACAGRASTSRRHRHRARGGSGVRIQFCTYACQC